MKPTTEDAIRLVHDGCLALAEVESVGMRIDVGRLKQAISDVGHEIDGITAELKSDDVWKIWRRRWGDRASLGSRHQIGVVFLDELGFKSGKTTKTGRAKMDAKVLESIDHPFVSKYLRLEKLKKLRGTYLKGVLREVNDGFLRPSFNLHLASTFRSSCDGPNFQNIPIRDAEIGKLIRSCFIPRDGHVLVEVDFSSLEFRVAACFWSDDAMIAYASDPSLDVHRDMAAECYLLHEVPKKARFYAKNQFVFPQLYGSYYVNCARNLWGAISDGGIETVDGQGLYDWLAAEGITSLGACNPQFPPMEGTFEKLIKEVEDNFHGRFPQWSERKDVWWDRYLKQGSFRLMTGFVCKGVYSRNNLYNTPIQGPAFHLLLWSLIQIVKKQKTTKMASRVIGQIHDSIVADVHEDELDDWLGMAKRVMTVDVRKHWNWIVTPLEIEAEVARTNWFEKEGVSL